MSRHRHGPIKESTVKQAAERLQRFLDDPFVKLSIRHLCAGPGEHIILCESYEGGGFGYVYFLDNKGIRCSTEAMGTWTAYAQASVPPPSIRACTALEAAREYAMIKGDPRRLVSRIRHQLVQRFIRALANV